jgi:bacillithiol biosynthesis deacetylase BshB1
VTEPSTKVDVLALGAHPDDVEIAAGGTLARCVDAGLRVAVAHLTFGEAGSRGSAELRRREAAAAAAALGVEGPYFASLGDGGLRTDRAAEDRVIELVRRLRPRLCLIPPSRDRHPDHERAHRLVRDALFYAGLARRGAGPPHRPEATWEVTLHESFEAPDVVVDVTATWARKEAALDAYGSQLAPRGGGPAASDDTVVSRPSFRAAIEARARVLGQVAGVELAEGFRSAGPLRLDPAAWLRGAGR